MKKDEETATAILLIGISVAAVVLLLIAVLKVGQWVLL